jgi:hypothetical protein
MAVGAGIGVAVGAAGAAGVDVGVDVAEARAVGVSVGGGVAVRRGAVGAGVGTVLLAGAQPTQVSRLIKARKDCFRQLATQVPRLVLFQLRV